MNFRWFIMKKCLLFSLIIFVIALVLVFIIMCFNINTNDTIKYSNITINIKHPLAYVFKKEPELAYAKTMQRYNVGFMTDASPLKIKLIKNRKQPPKHVIIDISYRCNTTMDMLYYSSDKSESDIIAEFQFKKNKKRFFYRIIRDGSSTIQMTAIQSDMIPFNKRKYKKEVEIIKNIKITDKKENNMLNSYSLKEDKSQPGWSWGSGAIKSIFNVFVSFYNKGISISKHHGYPKRAEMSKELLRKYLNMIYDNPFDYINDPDYALIKYLSGDFCAQLIEFNPKCKGFIRTISSDAYTGMPPSILPGFTIDRLYILRPGEDY